METSKLLDAERTGASGDHGKTRVDTLSSPENHSEVLQHPCRRRVDGPSTSCGICSGIDFTGIFKGTRPFRDVQKLPTLRQALSNLDCKFCQFLVQEFLEKIRMWNDFRDSALSEFVKVAEDILAQAEHGIGLDIAMELMPVLPAPVEYLQAQSVGDVRRAGVDVRLFSYHDCPPSPLIKVDNILSIYYDLVHIDSTIYYLVGSEAQSYGMVRRPIPHRFEPDTIREWLHASFEHPTSERPGRLNDHASLENLRQARRFRLLNVHSGQLVTPEKEERYVALSYVWGSEMAEYVETRMARMSSYVTLETLPQTIRDAASLVAAIDESYLWVDALCIGQNDAEDKHANISEMGAIYQNAFFTVIAAEGEGASAGLSRLRYGGQGSEQALVIETVPGSVSILKSIKSLDETIRSSKWSTRGWTMQERYLSRRCVYFTCNEVLFSCRDFEAREAYELIELGNASDGGKATTSNFLRPPSLHERLLEPGPVSFIEYATAVGEYTHTDLSHKGDRLDAFTGVLNQLYHPDTSLDMKSTLAGLPENGFLEALLWCFTRPSTPPARLRIDTRQTRLLPSWSWAGWQGECRLSFPPTREDHTRDVGLMVLDPANIIYWVEPDAEASTRSEMLRVPVSRPLRSILHLWTKAAHCDIVLRNPENAALGFDFLVSSQDTSSTPCKLTLDDYESAQFAMPSTRSELLLVILPIEPRHDLYNVGLMLVERCGGFFERLGFIVVQSGRGKLAALIEQTEPQWIRLQ